MRCAPKAVLPVVMLGLSAAVAPAAVAAAGSAPAGADAEALTLYASPAGTGTCAAVWSPCALRTAVTDALATGGSAGRHAAAIRLGPGTYSGVSLTLAPAVLASLTIEGTAASPTQTVLDGTTDGRVLDLTGTGTIRLDDLVVEKGEQPSGSGGCIADTTGAGGVVLRLQAVTLTRCTARVDGGAVFVGTPPPVVPRTSGTGTQAAGTTAPDAGLIATGVTFSTDRAGTGGALYVGTGPATLDGADFGADHATHAGGAVVTQSGRLTARASTFRADTTTFEAGAILVQGRSGTAAVSGSTFATDVAPDFGGAIVDDGLPVSLSDDTFVGDRADTGGAVTVTYGVVTARFDTFSHDTANGGGALWVTTSGTVDVADSVFQTADCSDKDGTFTDGGYNVASTASCTSAATSHGTSGTIHLAATLAANTSPGPETLAIGPDSSAFEEVPASACSVAADERGRPRPGVTGHDCDAGAYEAQVAVDPLTQTSPTSAAVAGGDGYDGQLTVSGAGPSTGPVTFVPTSTSPTVTVSASGAISVAAGIRTGRYVLTGTAVAVPYGYGTWSFTLTVGGSGYDLVGRDGGVFVFDGPGQAGGFYGSLPGIGVTPAAPIVGMVPTVDDRGYLLVGADGGVFAFGDAPFLGSAHQITPGLAPGGANAVVPSAPIVGIVATDSDHGYLLVGADGGVFAFGTARFGGSLPADGVGVSDVVGIAATPSGSGYWVVQATGTVTGFGAAQSVATGTTTSSVSAVAGTATGGGFWLVTQAGGVLPYGNAGRIAPGTLGALGVVPALPVIGIVPTDSTAGYWLVGRDGGVFAFGAAAYVGSLPGLTPPVRVTDIVGAAPT